MHIQEGETIVKVCYHHPFPFVLRALKIAVVSLPFYFVASFFSGVLNDAQMFWLYAAVTAIFGLIIVYDFTIYYLDQLVITNKRLLHINWHGLFSREETEAEFADIQDIETKEKGVLSNLKIFDFGLFRVETASSKVSIIFDQANDPEGIKHLIYHLQIKPSRIRAEVFETNATYDPERTQKDQTASVARQGKR